jgi:predicted MFS family arabinose efflux permease
VNWYNIGAVLPLIATGLHAGPAQLGIVLGAFLLGVGLFQVPAGLAAVRFGARRVSLVGIAVLGFSGVACAFAPSWPILALLRFVAGVGAAGFFSPALSLIASYFPAGRRGPVIGFYNGGFSVGGAVGLVSGAALGSEFGWPATLAIGGLALLGATGVAWAVLPRAATESRPGPLRDLLRASTSVLYSRSIWALSLGLTGFWALIYIVAQYFVSFGQEVHPGWGLGTAAVVAAILVVVSFPGGPLGGWLAEQGHDRRYLAIGFAAGAGLLGLLIPFLPLGPLIPVMVALGLLDGVVFAILYLIPSYLPESHGDGLALGVSLVNSVQVMLGSGLSIVFGFVVSWYGYTAAWEEAGAVTLLLLPLLLLVRPNRAESGRGGTRTAADSAS